MGVGSGVGIERGEVDQNAGQPHTPSCDGVMGHERCGWAVVGDMVLLRWAGEREGGRELVGRFYRRGLQYGSGGAVFVNDNIGE